MPSTSPLDAIGEAYARLVLAVGLHDPYYVDAFYGPAEWNARALAERAPLDVIKARAQKLLAELPAGELEELSSLRQRYLAVQTRSLIARVDMLSGTTFSFDEESRLLYDAVAPTHTPEHFQRIVAELGELLPGAGTVAEQYETFKAGFVIPGHKLDAVFQAAVAASRARTKQWIALPENESFLIEYVQDQPWSGYNWYQGNHHSLIQVNTDFPIHIDRALDLACHEGYPGHHVYNTLLETHLVKGRGWLEFTVYALFSPQSLIAEGTANHGIELVFPREERRAFEREVLFPMAGLDAAEVERFATVQGAVQKLAYAGNEAARRYLDGTFTHQESVQWLIDYALMSPERAQQRMQFFDRNRSYVINYNLGQDLVKAHLAAVPDDPIQRWQAFFELLSTPRVPSGLRRA
jgi:hypothetical protein